jgi:predicted nucleotidyltransferase
MRLTVQEVDVIKATARRIFGSDVRIWLFGSRVDDSKRGGDIDLYLETDEILESTGQAASRFGAELQMQLGEQKIDVLVVDTATQRQKIHEIALSTGIRL